MYNIEQQIFIWDRFTGIVIIIFAFIRTIIYTKHHIVNTLKKDTVTHHILSWFLCLFLFCFIFFFVVAPIYLMLNSYLYNLHTFIGSFFSIVFLSISLEISFYVTVKVIKIIL